MWPLCIYISRIQLVIPICLPGKNSSDVDQHWRRIARMLIRDSEWERTDGSDDALLRDELVAIIRWLQLIASFVRHR